MLCAHGLQIILKPELRARYLMAQRERDKAWRESTREEDGAAKLQHTVVLENDFEGLEERSTRLQ